MDIIHRRTMFRRILALRGFPLMTVRRYSQEEAMRLYQKLRWARGTRREELLEAYQVELDKHESIADARHNRIVEQLEKQRRVDWQNAILLWIPSIMIAPVLANALEVLIAKYF